MDDLTSKYECVCKAEEIGETSRYKSRKFIYSLINKSNVVVLPTIINPKPKQLILKPRIVLPPTPKAARASKFNARKASIAIVNVQDKFFEHLEPRFLTICDDRYLEKD